MKVLISWFYFSLLFIVLFFNSVLGQDTSKFNYYAVFDNILDSETDRISISKSCLSGDGSTIFLYGKNIDTDVYGIYTIKTDGSDLTHIPWPANVEGVNYMTINYDGSRAFFSNVVGTYRWRYVCKVEAGSASILIDATDYDEINGCYKVRCTDNGEYVFFNEDRDDIWKLHHTGSAPQLIIDDTNVPVPIERGDHIGDFDVSADGSKIAFILNGYYDGGWLADYQVYSYDGNFTKLTAIAEPATRTNVRISGDGSKIVFNDGHPTYKWTSVNFDASEFLPLEHQDFNFGGLAIDSIGNKIYYSDADANGGRILNSDGSKNFDLIPVWHPIFLWASYYACMNDAGNLISFFYDYSGVQYLMVGHLDNPTVLEDAPKIENIMFDPLNMPDNDPDARILAKAHISDKNGLDDIEKISVDEILNGYQNKDFAQIPIFFVYDPNDNGEYGDEVANDGIYTTRGKPGGGIDTVKQMDVRIAVQDYAHTITVADVTIYVGPASSIDSRDDRGLIESYELYQNYPNPFNPSTIISYQLPATSIVILNVYDVLGNEIAVIEIGQKPGGVYEVEFEASHLSNGIYFYRINAYPVEGGANKFSQAKKMILLK